MWWGSLLLVGACLVGCGPTDPAQTDGGPSDDGRDGPEPGTAELTIEWATTPSTPGTTAAGNQIDDVKIRMENLKAIVDVDPNNPNTTKAEYQLEWDSDSGPEAIRFENAPAGRYTSIVLQLADGNEEKSFDIRGNDNDGDSFKIDDDASLSIVIDCDATLAPGSEMTLVIDIDLQAAIDPVVFDTLPADDGVDHHLDDEEDPTQMAAFRNRLQLAFQVREGN
jgi:hypothetical protein